MSERRWLCPSCGAPVAATDQICGQCEARIVEPRAAAPIASPRPATPAAARSSGGARRSKAPERPQPAPAERSFMAPVIGAVVAVAAIAAIVAVVVAGGEDPDPTSSRAAAGGGAAHARDGKRGRDARRRATAHGAVVPGTYVRLASMRTIDSARSLADDLGDDGIDAIAIQSDAFAELLPGFGVVVSGPVDSTAQERRIIRRARRAGIGDAFSGTLTPGAATLDVSRLAGTWTGEPGQAAARRERDNGPLPTELELAGDGSGGQVRYPERGCSGSLDLQRVRGATATYAETIETGSCLRGGYWLLKLVNGRLGAVWRTDDRKVFVAGLLDR